MPSSDEPWLRYPGAAKVLGISRGTLEVWLSTKRYGVPHYKIGRNVLFKRSELVAWLESRRRGGNAYGE
jgi:excisionase family DNA binding protein